MSKEKITRQQALEWCQNFLRGAWSTINAEQIQINQIPGGLSNYLYLCSLPENIEPLNNEPRKVLLRIYGEAHRKHRSTLLIDSVVCTLLSERRLGPKVHGVFPDGRVEEFVEAECLLVSEIREKNIAEKIARLLAELHQIDMPLVKEPVWLYNTIERYIADLPKDIPKFTREEDRTIFNEIRSVCNLKEEFENLKNLLSTVDSPVCFTHNDFQPGNILRLISQPDNFTVIDFEYCSYNYRGFDIGNHFCEYMFDYKSSTTWPHFHVDFTLYPSEDQQMNFLRSYVQTSNPTMTPIEQDDLARQIMKEANFYAMATNFFWTLWSIHMAVSTSIEFGYMEYGRARLTAYYLIRDQLTGVNGATIPPQITEKLLRSTQNPFHRSYNLMINKTN